MAPAESAKIPPFFCRFEEISSDGKADESYRDFCAFEFPGCAGCPKAFHNTASVSMNEDPLKSKAWCGIQSPHAFPSLYLGGAQKAGSHSLSELVRLVLADDVGR
jgi:hypothetical protein